MESAKNFAVAGATAVGALTFGKVLLLIAVFLVSLILGWGLFKNRKTIFGKVKKFAKEVKLEADRLQNQPKTQSEEKHDQIHSSI